jgi:anti-sigma regulatory factor (Ser/Thr protein kinase)
MQQIARQLPFDNRQVADITLAVAEACVNGVRYGSTDAVKKHEPVVTVTAQPGEDHLSIEVQDFGAGFEFERVTMPEASAESGRGIALIHALMDKVAITSTRRGTRVRMVKYYTATSSRK